MKRRPLPLFLAALCVTLCAALALASCGKSKAELESELVRSFHMKHNFTMKKLICVLFLAALPAAFAADPFYCKWCGASFANVCQLVTSPCTRSPAGKHEPYEGAARRFYVCQYCAFESANFTQLVTSLCSKSPGKYHQAYEGAEKASYTCKYCNTELPSFKQLVNSPCRKSPRGYHDAR